MADARDPVEVYVAVGSNIEPETNIPAALELLRRAVEVTGVSRFYRTAALGRPGDPDFANGAFRVRTTLGPRELKEKVLRPIEAQLGRERGADPSAPRTIDLDIALWGDEVIGEPGLRIPAADISRPFVAAPLLELAPDYVLPDTGRPLSSVCSKANRARLVPAEELTRTLKET